MSSITTDQGIVHYEVYGRGKPVILLHGWLGSWGLWQETMGFLGRYYRTYALDFWGFGESGKKRETYAVQDFVSLVNQFMEQLGIMHAPLVGHSMGGTVSLSVAIRYPERVSKVVVVGSPIAGSSLAFPLKLAGMRPIAFLLFNMMSVFRFGVRVASPFICRDERFADMMDRDLSRTTIESFLLSIASLRRTDLRPMLDRIKIPAMGMYGDRDVIVHPKQWQPMLKGIPQTQVERFPLAGHFIMLEEPEDFAKRLKAFLDEEVPIRSTAQVQPSPLNTTTTSVTLAP
ncbi:MAG TPA: alpha/beta hydrolase [Anaerolineales bacterium]|nr:alpha/beta hydrolase [Anaerolineales bacterium]